MLKNSGVTCHETQEVDLVLPGLIPTELKNVLTNLYLILERAKISFSLKALRHSVGSQ